MKRIILVCLACAYFSAAFFVAPATARAALAEEQTVLYYLIEMQRRTGRGCDGSAMSGAPSLIPSETLRALAKESSKSGGQAVDKDSTPLFTAFCTGATAQQAVQNLMAAHCTTVMSHEWRYIGAYEESGRWAVVMAARDPDQWIPAEPGQTNQGQAPMTEGVAAVSAASPVTGQSQATHGALAEDARTAYSTGPRTAKNEPSYPASPVVVGEFQTDSLGRPILPPSGSMSTPARQGAAPLTDARQNPALDSHQNPGPETAKNEPVYPASPVVVGEIQVDALGRPLLPPAGAMSAPAQQGVAPLTDVRQTPAPGGYQSLGPETANGIQSQSSRVVGTAPVRVVSPPPDPMVMLGLVNGVRIKGALCAGVAMPAVPALAPDSKMMAAASRHAEDMAARSYFSSLTPEGVTLGQRLIRVGYNWGFLAENIARGSSSPERIIQSWLAGDEQCRNIMDPQYSHAGIGFAQPGQLWVLTVAAPMAGDAGLRLR